jgi:hypothetical protein
LDWDENRSHAPAAVQQPSGQELGPQPQMPVTVLQPCPAGQAEHALPLAPHTDSDCDA